MLISKLVRKFIATCKSEPLFLYSFIKSETYFWTWHSTFIPLFTGPIYSLCQKKRTFNPEFFWSPPGGGSPKIHLVDYVNRTPIYIIDHVNFWPPSSRGATKKIGIKCAFLLTQTVCRGSHEVCMTSKNPHNSVTMFSPTPSHYYYERQVYYGVSRCIYQDIVSAV